MTTTAATVPAQAAPAPKPKAKDPRYLALRNFAISMTVFNILGYTLLGFEQPWLWPLVAVATGYTTEIVMEMISAWADRRTPGFRGRGPRGVMEFLLPAHITSLAVNLLLYGNTKLWPVLLGVVVGVSGKHILRAPINGRMKHYMNPSNFGITVVLLVFPWVSIAPPYEFTERVNGVFRIFIPLLIVTAGTTLNAVLTKKVPLIMGWVGGFAIQAIIRAAFWHVALWSALGVMTGVAFVLFTNYMITDPGTSPFKARPQFIFGASVAMTYGALMLFNIVYTLFYAVCIVCAVRGLGWWVAAYRRKRRAAAQQQTTITLPSPTKPQAVQV